MEGKRTVTRIFLLCLENIWFWAVDLSRLQPFVLL